MHDDRPTPPGPEAVAYLGAVDLGSNSFHMAIARVDEGIPVLVDALREPVKLARGLDAEGRIAEDAVERALACLERFRQRLRHIPVDRVRAVGTNTLRQARKPHAFLEQAEAALGHPIEIVAGTEEARLIYLGVAQDLADDTGPRLVVDIGGGSTECVLGERFEPHEAHSLHMGCVDFTNRFFASGEIKKKTLEQAVLAARSEIQTIERRFRDLGWERAIGASGTIRTARDILEREGWSPMGITPAGLKRLRKALLQAGHVRKLPALGVKADRAPVFPGGFAILLALFDAFEIEVMEAASGALREGVLYDLLGRIRHEDVRERTIRILQERYHVDVRQAARVERAALEFLRQAAPGWKLDPVEAGRFLTWASRLHEIGLAIAYGHHHRHGGYILEHADMPGFSKDDQQLLAAVVGGHRRKVRMAAFDALKSSRLDLARRLLALLRLAVLLNRERGPHPLAPIRLEGTDAGLGIRVPADWLERHPMTRQDFEREAAYLKSIGVALRVEPTEG